MRELFDPILEVPETEEGVWLWTLLGNEFFVDGNGVTHFSQNGDGITNHREGDTSIMMGLCSLESSEKWGFFCGNDFVVMTCLLFCWVITRK